MELKVEWYALNDWGVVWGPFYSKNEAWDDIENNYKYEHRCSLEEYKKNWIVFPQVVKSEGGGQ